MKSNNNTHMKEEKGNDSNKKSPESREFWR